MFLFVCRECIKDIKYSVTCNFFLLTLHCCFQIEVDDKSESADEKLTFRIETFAEVGKICSGLFNKLKL